MQKANPRIKQNFSENMDIKEAWEKRKDYLIVTRQIT